MFQRFITTDLHCGDKYNWAVDKVVEPTEAEKKRRRFGTMFTLHALLNRAGVKHENSHTLICMGYVKTKDRF